MTGIHVRDKRDRHTATAVFRSAVEQHCRISTKFCPKQVVQLLPEVLNRI